MDSNIRIKFYQRDGNYFIISFVFLGMVLNLTHTSFPVIDKSEKKEVTLDYRYFGISS